MSGVRRARRKRRSESMLKVNKHKWNAADSVTSVRIALSILLLFFSADTNRFLIVYTAAGVTDVLDGLIARKIGAVGEFGARLDSIADLMFYGIMLVKLFPRLYRALPIGVICAAGVVLLLRAASYIIAAIKYHRFASLHTWLNKLCGASVFLLPYIPLSAVDTYGWAACALTFAAALEELLIHLTQKEYIEGKKSVFPIKGKAVASEKTE